MFTVKFKKMSASSNESNCVSISCQAYDAHHREDGSYTITVFKGMTLKDGVEYHITTDPLFVNSYDYCYVENSTGKTIAKYNHVKINWGSDEELTGGELTDKSGSAGG